MGSLNFADVLGLSIRAWLVELEPSLENFPPDARRLLIFALRSAFLMGVGRTAHLADAHTRFGGTASLEHVYKEVVAALPEAEELAKEHEGTLEHLRLPDEGTQDFM